MDGWKYRSIPIFDISHFLRIRELLLDRRGLRRNGRVGRNKQQRQQQQAGDHGFDWVFQNTVGDTHVLFPIRMVPIKLFSD